jgi:hypothetical protein
MKSTVAALRFLVLGNIVLLLAVLPRLPRSDTPLWTMMGAAIGFSIGAEVILWGKRGQPGEDSSRSGGI